MTTLRPDEKYPQSSCAEKNKPEVGTNKCKEGIKQSWWRGNYVTSRLFSILPISAWSEWKITASQRAHRHILVGNHETTEQYVLPKSKASTLLNSPRTFQPNYRILRSWDDHEKTNISNILLMEKILHHSEGCERWLYLSNNTFSYPAKWCRIFSIKRTIAGG